MTTFGSENNKLKSSLQRQTDTPQRASRRNKDKEEDQHISSLSSSSHSGYVPVKEFFFDSICQPGGRKSLMVHLYAKKAKTNFIFRPSKPFPQGFFALRGEILPRGAKSIDTPYISVLETIKESVFLSTTGSFRDEISLGATDQNEVLASKGVTPTGPTEFMPLTKKTVTYIVAAVVVNSDNQVLMIQEAKPSCAGQWYLPAGRMESGETIIDAVKREVLEETGLELEPTTLLMVESAAGSWFRFVLTGSIIGGQLKTTAEADSESLQAKWVGDIKSLQLRSNDIVPLIQKGLEYHMNRAEPWHAKTMPQVIGHKKLYMRFIIAVRRKANNRVTVLVSEKDHVHLPMCEINPLRSIHSTMKKYMNEIFGSDLPQHRPHGILSVEYNGTPAGQHDGVCLNIFISIRQPVEEVNLIDKYSWKDLSPPVGEDLIGRIGKNLCIPLHVIR